MAVDFFVVPTVAFRALFVLVILAHEYLHTRTHLALDKDTPIPRSVAPPTAGRVVATPQVGGLHHRYDRVAA